MLKMFKNIKDVQGKEGLKTVVNWGKQAEDR